MKTINLCLEDECFEWKRKNLPREYTWRRLLKLGIKAAIRELQKKAYYRSIKCE